MPEGVKQAALDRLVRMVTVNMFCSVEDRQHLAMLLDTDGALRALSARDAICAVGSSRPDMRDSQRRRPEARRICRGRTLLTPARQGR
ncbi:hypothetical protein BST10_10830 [Mycolicibacter algericus DSM 45454]|uniref:Uncharacterized protein n=1 Tax=Mycolicibacter algericus DSM 45454 TaxID=723879 RepID=A0ABX3RSB2_MYCAL|nr:hypothetical protein BST10_10830 [Mycolicibacter algericus DSM 45454]